MINMFQKMKKIIKNQDILEWVLDRPHMDIYASQLAEELDCSVAKASRVLRNWESLSLLTSNKKGVEKIYRVNLHSPLTRQLKVFLNIYKLLESGALDYILNNSKNPKSLILYGSMAKGVNDVKSDWDLFLVSSDTTVDVMDLEDLLKTSVNFIHVRSSRLVEFKKQNPALYEEIILYGIPLYGDKMVV